ncbi:MAG: Regulatory protein RecX [Candidatus Erwinia impunctatus]|nr:Regulatory protein RecX [Culicoides impunctatus]
MMDECRLSPLYHRMRQKALRILSLRDHSEQELRIKLSAALSTSESQLADDQHPSEGTEALEQVIQWCKVHNYIDDLRFAVRFLSMRSQKGYGAQRIGIELNQKGIERSVVKTLLSETEIDWCLVGRDVARRKFGEPLPEEWKAKMKVQRFLLSRGFTPDDIREIYRQDDQ